MADICIKNPFSIGIVQEDGFCNRVKEKEELLLRKERPECCPDFSEEVREIVAGNGGVQDP